MSLPAPRNDKKYSVFYYEGHGKWNLNKDCDTWPEVIEAINEVNSYGVRTDSIRVVINIQLEISPMEGGG